MGSIRNEIKRFSIETYGEITFRPTNVIPERIIFVSRGITVLIKKQESDNPKKFKLVLQQFLSENPIYPLDEYFELPKKVKYIYI